MVHMAFFLLQMVTWSDILVALDVYPRPTNASTQCCCAFLSIVNNGFRMFVVFTIDLFAYHGSLASDFRPAKCAAASNPDSVINTPCLRVLTYFLICRRSVRLLDLSSFNIAASCIEGVDKN